MCCVWFWSPQVRKSGKVGNVDWLPTSRVRPTVRDFTRKNLVQNSVVQIYKVHKIRKGGPSVHAKLLKIF